jgi:hypothetical protein
MLEIIETVAVQLASTSTASRYLRRSPTSAVAG